MHPNNHEHFCFAGINHLLVIVVAVAAVCIAGGVVVFVLLCVLKKIRNPQQSNDGDAGQLANGQNGVQSIT